MRVYMRIKGRVQGVGYRFFVRETAQKLSATGWVQNLPDGDVECEAQGEASAIGRMIQRLETDHPYARVEKITSQKIPDIEREKGFEIRT